MEYFASLTMKQKLGIVIKYNRIKHKKTQDDLSRHINCDQSVISRIEIGLPAIDIELYDLAMSYFNLYYQLDNPLLKSNIEHFWEAIFFLDEVILDEIRETLNVYHDDVIYNYHQAVILSFFLYLENDIKRCTSQIEELKELIYICTPHYQMIYLITRLFLASHQSEYQEGLIIIKHLESQKQFEEYRLSYYIGWFYFKFNNRSMALKYLLFALSENKKCNNYKRIYRISVTIISLLIKEKNYNLAIRETKQLLKLYQQYLALNELFIIYFLIGYIYYLLKQYNLAIEYFNRANVLETKSDKNHIYYYLLNIYDTLDDVKQYRNILNKIDNEDEGSFGHTIINLYLQSRIGKSIKYYQYIEKAIVPLIRNHYEKLEINAYVQELLNYYYETKQYNKYHQLSQKMLKYFA